MKLRYRWSGLHFSAILFAFLSIASLFAPPAYAQSESGIDWAAAKEFWCFKAPVSYPRPKVNSAFRPRRTIDYFILSALERKKLTPAPQAERRTLIRRLSFDLTGLPPTPKDVDQFLEDTRPNAYELLVERLLGRA